MKTKDISFMNRLTKFRKYKLIDVITHYQDSKKVFFVILNLFQDLPLTPSPLRGEG